LRMYLLRGVIQQQLACPECLARAAGLPAVSHTCACAALLLGLSLMSLQCRWAAAIRAVVLACVKCLLQCGCERVCLVLYGVGRVFTVMMMLLLPRWALLLLSVFSGQASGGMDLSTCLPLLVLHHASRCHIVLSCWQVGVVTVWRGRVDSVCIGTLSIPHSCSSGQEW
jgi:hypothetical protein